jgi:hypothetical protein
MGDLVGEGGLQAVVHSAPAAKRQPARVERTDVQHHAGHFIRTGTTH